MLHSIGHWLGKVDPNILVPVLLTLGTWVWNKLGGETKQAARAIVDKVIDNIARELRDNGDTFGAAPYDVALFLKRSRAYIEERVWTALGKRGIKRSKQADALVNESIERATGWLADEFKRRGRPAA